MKLNWFSKGIRIPDRKARTHASIQIHPVDSPRDISLSLVAANGERLTPYVNERSPVKIGTKLAVPETQAGVPIFSSVSGRVRRITENTIEVESNMHDRVEAGIEAQTSIPNDPEVLIKLIRETGIVDLGGRHGAVHARLEKARRFSVQTLVMDACESEPFLTADHMLMMNHAAEVLKGVELLRVASGAASAVIVAQNDKREPIELLNSKNYQLHFDRVHTRMVPSVYPQDEEALLVQAACGVKPRWSEDLIRGGVLVENVATAFAVYEAVYLRKPLFERVMTVGGPCVTEPKNLWARAGMRAVDLLRYARGLLRDPEALVFGGPMRGRTVNGLMSPVSVDVRAVLALPAEMLPQEAEEEACIRCGYCVDACPEDLFPETLVHRVREGDASSAIRFRIDACTECGACDYACPSHIPILKEIRRGKRMWLTLKQTARRKMRVHELAGPKAR